MTRSLKEDALKIKGTLQTPNGGECSYALYYFGPAGLKDLGDNIRRWCCSKSEVYWANQRNKDSGVVGTGTEHAENQKKEWESLWDTEAWKAKLYMAYDDKAVAITLANEPGVEWHKASPWTSLLVASPKVKHNSLNLHPVLAYTGGMDDRSYSPWCFPCDLEAILNLQPLLYALWKKPVEIKHKVLRNIYSDDRKYYQLKQTTKPGTLVVIVSDDQVMDA
jgi:hypothetical protein